MALTSVTYPWVLIVTIVYYMALFDFNEPFVWSWTAYVDIFLHFLLTVCAILDTIVSSRPWSLWHSWFVSFCGVIYLLFNAMYILVFDGTGINDQEYIYRQVVIAVQK